MIWAIFRKMGCTVRLGSYKYSRTHIEHNAYLSSSPLYDTHTTRYDTQCGGKQPISALRNACRRVVWGEAIGNACLKPTLASQPARRSRPGDGGDRGLLFAESWGSVFRNKLYIARWRRHRRCMKPAVHRRTIFVQQESVLLYCMVPVWLCLYRIAQLSIPIEWWMQPRRRTFAHHSNIA